MIRSPRVARARSAGGRRIGRPSSSHLRHLRPGIGETSVLEDHHVQTTRSGGFGAGDRVGPRARDIGRTREQIENCRATIVGCVDRVGIALVVEDAINAVGLIRIAMDNQRVSRRRIDRTGFRIGADAVVFGTRHFGRSSAPPDRCVSTSPKVIKTSPSTHRR